MLKNDNARCAVALEHNPVDGQLAEEELARWQASLPERWLSPPKSDSNEARSQWLSSRRSLFRVARQLERQGVPSSRAHFSLAHTNTHSIAVGVEASCEPSVFNSGPCTCAIGVDLEASTRHISTQAAGLFFRSHEQALGLSALQAWVIKEACFKANVASDRTIIADYSILSFDHACSTGVASCAKTPGTFAFQLVEAHGLTFALTFARCK